ncbi:MAG: hypothetical protein HZB51_15525 [Chloroflexi bacterium]|nr:hypothetical protein [Chloroflexota bacterium]
MNKDSQPKQVKTSHWMRQITISAVLLLGIFLLGFVPMWLQSRDYASRLSTAERQLTLAGIKNSLATAVIDGRRGDYEPARLAASKFFNSLRAETDRGIDSTFSPAQIAGVQPLYSGRDEIITLLARGDPASADRLSEMYVSYLKIMNQ